MKQMEADVIVVAGGASGLAAALTAAENGAEVIVFEKANTTGGCANMAMGLLGIDTRMQRDMLIDLTVEKAFNRAMEWNHWRVNANLLRKYFSMSASTIEWLESIGVEFVAPSKYFPGSEATWHLIKPKSGKPGLRAAATMIKIMTDRAKEMGIEICLETPVKKLIKEDGAVVGVEAQDKNGEKIEARAGAVIMATGGFGDNPEFIKEYTGYEWGKDMWSYRIPGLTGDGIKMAWEAGADKDFMGMEAVYFVPDSGGYAPIEIPFRQGDLFVNLDGKRFMNEQLMENPVFTENAILRQKKRFGFALITEEIFQHYEKKGVPFVNVVTAGADMNYVRQQFQEYVDTKNENLVVAGTIEEVAEKTGINKENLVETVAEYNACCDSVDTLFGKENRFMHKITGSKIYALRFAPSGYGSFGGIRINENAEALDSEQNVIPGLYAVGTDANSMYDYDYAFILPGNSLGFAVNSGRIAGGCAVDYIKENFVE